MNTLADFFHFISRFRNGLFEQEHLNGDLAEFLKVLKEKTILTPSGLSNTWLCRCGSAEDVEFPDEQKQTEKEYAFYRCSLYGGIKEWLTKEELRTYSLKKDKFAKYIAELLVTQGEISEVDGGFKLGQRSGVTFIMLFEQREGDYDKFGSHIILVPTENERLQKRKSYVITDYLSLGEYPLEPKFRDINKLVMEAKNVLPIDLNNSLLLDAPTRTVLSKNSLAGMKKISYWNNVFLKDTDIKLEKREYGLLYFLYNQAQADPDKKFSPEILVKAPALEISESSIGAAISVLLNLHRKHKGLPPLIEKLDKKIRLHPQLSTVIAATNKKSLQNSLQK